MKSRLGMEQALEFLYAVIDCVLLTGVLLEKIKVESIKSTEKVKGYSKLTILEQNMPN